MGIASFIGRDRKLGILSNDDMIEVIGVGGEGSILNL